MTKLDDCNVGLAGLPSCDLDRLCSVISAAARLTVGAQHHDHITPLLADLHWLADASAHPGSGNDVNFQLFAFYIEFISE